MKAEIQGFAVLSLVHTSDGIGSGVGIGSARSVTIQCKSKRGIGSRVGIGSGVGIGIARSVTIQCKSKNGVGSGVGSSTEEELEGSEEFLFLPIPFPLPSLSIQ